MKENTTTNGRPDNSRLYEALRHVPEEAKKLIQEGRLKGKTDVNAMWRIKRMTEIFGPIGQGWKVEIKQKWLESADNDNVAAFVDIDLYYKDPQTDEWNGPIPGTGGNIFKRRESSGRIYMDDDCYKKALTDAISIACKFLGLAADVWFEQDVSKYEPSGTQVSEKKGSSTTTGQQSSKVILNPMSKYWNSSVTRAAGINASAPEIRKRMETKFIISDSDFAELMRQAGKPL